MWPAIWVSICATAGLAAEAVSTCGVFPPTTIAPDARRPVIAWRAAVGPAARITSNAAGCWRAS